MAEPLKQQFSLDVARRLASMIEAVWPAFRSEVFVADVAEGFDTLELMDRGRHIARVLRRHLPDAYPKAVAILLESVTRQAGTQRGVGMAVFFYLPHVCFVAEFGLDHFDESMQAQYVLTQHFTAEFSIRPFIEQDEARALTLLRQWARDPDVHVRRLVSEGTRTRLPWAGRLRRFQANPAPVLELLELLKDDPELYVRRSVANNLNDIGKDHPDVLIEVATRWMVDATPEREALVRHALRSLIKQGHPDALRILGVGRKADVAIEQVVITPRRVTKGGKVSLTFVVRNTSRRSQRLLVDFRIHFVKASGATSPKVFKLKTLQLPGGGIVSLRKTVSIADLSTRRHHAGRHAVDVLVNGVVTPIGDFVVAERPS